jgi:hypothetical protein
MEKNTNKAKIIGRIRQREKIRNGSQQAARTFKKVKGRAVRFLKKEKGKNNGIIPLVNRS